MKKAMSDAYDNFLKDDARRAFAWEALKNTRNPEYVAARYNYPVSKMREALAKLPDEEPLYKQLKNREHSRTGRD